MPIAPISSSLVRSGSNGADVRELQQSLKDKGFDPQGVDGQVGRDDEGPVQGLDEDVAEVDGEVPRHMQLQPDEALGRHLEGLVVEAALTGHIVGDMGAVGDNVQLFPIGVYVPGVLATPGEAEFIALLMVERARTAVGEFVLVARGLEGGLVGDGAPVHDAAVPVASGAGHAAFKLEVEIAEHAVREQECVRAVHGRPADIVAHDDAGGIDLPQGAGLALPAGEILPIVQLHVHVGSLAEGCCKRRGDCQKTQKPRRSYQDDYPC